MYARRQPHARTRHFFALSLPDDDKPPQHGAPVKDMHVRAEEAWSGKRSCSIIITIMRALLAFRWQSTQKYVPCGAAEIRRVRW